MVTDGAVRRAAALIEAGRVGDAAEVLRAHLVAHPDDAAALGLLARSFLHQSEFARAEDAAASALALDPHNSPALRVLALARAELGRARDARAAADRAVDLDGNDWRAHLARAQVDVSLGRTSPRGLAASERARRLAPDEPDVHLIAAAILAPYVAPGDRAAARGHIESALALDPGHPFGLALLAELEVGTRWGTARGARLTAQAVAADPGGPLTRPLLARAIRRMVGPLPLLLGLLLGVVALIGAGDAELPATETPRYPILAAGAAVFAALMAGAVGFRVARDAGIVGWRLLRSAPRVSRALAVWLVIVGAALAATFVLPALPRDAGLVVIGATLAALVLGRAALAIAQLRRR